MSRLGRGELSHGDHLDVEHTLECIDAVTAAEVGAVAADVLRRPRGVAVVGPYAHARDLPAAVQAAVAG